MLTEGDYYLSKLINIVKNHVARAEEGRRLISEGRSLSEMTTDPIGLTAEETVKRRQGYLDLIGEVDDSRLIFIYGNTLYQLERRYEHPDKGTSELEWQRIALENEFGTRDLSIPDVNFDDVRSGRWARKYQK